MTAPDPAELPPERQQDAGYFRFLESDGVDWDACWDVLCGRVAGAIFRGALTPEVCERTCRSFWGSPLLASPNATRSTERAIGPLLLASGSLDAYLTESERTRTALAALCDGPGRTLPSLLGEWQAYLAGRGIPFRLAEHEGRRAGAYKLRSRADSKSFGLLPHDDAVHSWMLPHLAGFEIEGVKRVCNALVCLENGPGGELVYWNASFTPDDRQAMGMRPDSYGYPLEALTGLESITLPIRAGDMYIFDGANVHAVAPSGAEDPRRTVAVWITGPLDDGTVLQWA
ncbi:2OG-Fe(II) oxygenase [Streptomyces sp. NBC_00876]|uniref:hypothetical protein n=1 Tax=Streptomyces sp. NBC_00876 TaxID=2975853 RepID=UPI00386B3700|nr:2OG-Fe(II) oxygenase [Streptomyces sp. NBC_00876]